MQFSWCCVLNLVACKLQIAAPRRSLAGQDLEESAKQKQCSMKLYNSVYMYTVH